MFINSFINQGGNSGLGLFWILVPISLCLLTISQWREKRLLRGKTEMESWYTTKNIDTIYKTIEFGIKKLQRDAESNKEETISVISRIKSSLLRNRMKKRFQIIETIPPRFYQLNDESRPVYFELTEVEGGGTIIKATFHSNFKNQISKLKTAFSIPILNASEVATIRNRCPNCGKPILLEFKLCPYCGKKLKSH